MTAAPSSELTGIFDLAGRVAVVTGGTSGIGFHAAHVLARCGSTVVLAARTVEHAHDAAASITAEGHAAFGARVDVTDPESVRALADSVLEDHGHVDILINSAGVYSASKSEDLPIGEWLRILDVNATGTLLCCQEFGRHMLNRGYGKIVNIGSASSLVGMARAAAYTASKGAVLQLTRSLGAEWAARGVNVNAIAPCDFRTPMTDEFLDTPDYRAWLAQAVPIGRPGELDELSGAIVLLSSQAANMIVGHCLAVDGGRTAI